MSNISVNQLPVYKEHDEMSWQRPKPAAIKFPPRQGWLYGKHVLVNIVLKSQMEGDKIRMANFRVNVFIICMKSYIDDSHVICINMG